VAGADFTDVVTTDAHAAGVSWPDAKVQPAALPEAVKPPRWLPLVILGVAVALFLTFRMVRRAVKGCNYTTEGVEESQA
jgi:hypothetical protein